MPGPILGLHAQGADVARLQLLLNKVGGMLPGSELFGELTESAVKDAQFLAERPETGVADGALWDWLERQPEPSPELSARSVTFIAEMEVDGRGGYQARWRRPHWPGGESGITIGIGYDLKEQGGNFAFDWGDVLTGEVRSRLTPHLNVTGSDAARRSLSDLSIPVRGAWRCFVARTLPRYVAMTRDKFGPALYDRLPDPCRGALVSLVYNRGAALQASDGSRVEMRNIRDLLAAGRAEDVPAEFRKMKRLWTDSGLDGLVKRREAEAKLWEEGLAAALPGPPA